MQLSNRYESVTGDDHVVRAKDPEGNIYDTWNVDPRAVDEVFTPTAAEHGTRFEFFDDGDDPHSTLPTVFANGKQYPPRMMPGSVELVAPDFPEFRDDPTPKSQLLFDDVSQRYRDWSQRDWGDWRAAIDDMRKQLEENTEVNAAELLSSRNGIQQDALLDLLRVDLQREQRLQGIDIVGLFNTLQPTDPDSL